MKEDKITVMTSTENMLVELDNLSANIRDMLEIIDALRALIIIDKLPK